MKKLIHMMLLLAVGVCYGQISGPPVTQYVRKGSNAQRLALASPPTGVLWSATDTTKLWLYSGSWTDITGGTGGGGVAWGGITGTLSNQTDLQLALDAKEGTVTWGDGLQSTAGTASVDFNATNLQITATEINTIQNINSTATPTFGTLTLTANSDTIGISHDGTDANFTTTDGMFRFYNSEGGGIASMLRVDGNGTVGIIRAYDEDDAEWCGIHATTNEGYITVGGSAPGDLNLVYGGASDVEVADGAADAETPYFAVFGFPTGTALHDIKLQLAAGPVGQITSSTGTIDFNDENLTTSGNIDGRDVSTDGSTLDSHTGNTSNPHTVTATQVGLGNVEDTVLSTWAGSANITTLGTIASGVWSGTDVAVAAGGTGVSTLADGGLVIGNGTGAVEVVSAGLTTQVLVGGGASTAPAWGTDLPTAVTIGAAYVYRTSGTDVPVADGGTGASDAATARSNLGVNTGQFHMHFDGGGSAVTTGEQDGIIYAYKAVTITGYKFVSNESTTTTVAVWADTTFPPTIADLISAAAPASITASDQNLSGSIAGWTTAIAADTFLKWDVTANDTLITGDLFIEYTY